MTHNSSIRFYVLTLMCYTASPLLWLVSNIVPIAKLIHIKFICEDPCGHVFSPILIIRWKDLEYLYRTKESK